MTTVRPSARTTASAVGPTTSSIWPALLIVVAGLCTYWSGANGPFVWDDQTSIVTNRSIQQLWPLSQPLRPPRETPVAGRPLVNVSFAINYALGGLDPVGYHAGNIAIHLGCALLLFGIVRRTLKEKTASLALGAALLWMLHPLQSEAVDYLTQRTESLMAFFFLLTLYCAIRAPATAPAAVPAASRAARDGKRSPKVPQPPHEPSMRHAVAWGTLSALACAAGMASKESMATAPLIVVLYDRTFLFGSWREAFSARKYLYAALAATWLIVIAILWQQPRSTAGFTAATGAWTYALNQTQMIVRYLKLTIWPKDLVLDYGLPRALKFRDVIPESLVVGGLLVATFLAWKRWPTVGFLAATFWLTLAPSSSVIPIASEVGAERRMYLPFAALATLAAVAVNQLVARIASRSPNARRVRRLAAASTVIALGLLATRTIVRTLEYSTPLSLWQTVVDRRPHGRARMALASELVAAGQRQEAFAQLYQAVNDYPDARFALGTELVDDNRLDEGIAELRAFIGAKPEKLDRIPARSLLGQALAAQGKLDEAAAELKRILTIVPSDSTVRTNLADVLAAQRHYEEAIAEYRTVLAGRPENAAVLSKLGFTLSSMGRFAEAIEPLERARASDPQSAATNRALAEAYLRRNDLAQGESHAREAVRLEPGDAVAHNLLGVALASNGRMAEAITEFRRSLQINPNDLQAQNNLERALRVASVRPR